MAFGLAGLNMLAQIPQGYQDATTQRLKNQLLQQEADLPGETARILEGALPQIIPGVGGLSQMGQGTGGGPQPVPFAPGTGGPQGGIPSAWGVNPSGPQVPAMAQAQGGAGPSASDQDLAVLRSMEGGPNGYGTVGVATRGDRPYGAYGVMGANVGPWTQEVLGRRDTPQQFLASREDQDAVARAKFGQYEQQYGREGAARAWLGGPGAVNAPGRRDVLGTSVGDYGQRFAQATGGGMPGGMGGMPGGMDLQRAWQAISRQPGSALGKIKAMDQLQQWMKPNERMQWEYMREMMREDARRTLEGMKEQATREKTATTEAGKAQRLETTESGKDRRQREKEAAQATRVAVKDQAKQQDAESFIHELDSAIDDVNKQVSGEGPHVVGVLGRATRGLEFVEGMFGGGGETPASTFQSKILALQERWPRLVTGVGRIAGDERRKLDDIIRGLGNWTNASQALNSLQEARKQLVDKYRIQEWGSQAGQPLDDAAKSEMRRMKEGGASFEQIKQWVIDQGYDPGSE